MVVVVDDDTVEPVLDVDVVDDVVVELVVVDDVPVVVVVQVALRPLQQPTGAHSVGHDWQLRFVALLLPWHMSACSHTLNDSKFTPSVSQ